MVKHLYLIPVFALGLAACSQDTLEPNGSENLGQNQETVNSNLQHASLKSINSSKSRVNVLPATRAEEDGPLSLVAEIENLSNQGGIDGFVAESRDLSASCVYYDQNENRYYVTYHMQGNNYNTHVTHQTGGFIETFTIDEKGTPNIEKVFMAANPNELSFDFNHLYFDDLTKYNFGGSQDDFVHNGTRLIAVGHLSSPSSKENGQPNTAAIIGRLNLENGQASLDYQKILTGEKMLDAEGKSLGDIDAGDANCVIRKANHYYVATRKGLAVVRAAENNLFDPIYDYPDGENIYFIKTPGSAKYLSHETTWLNSSHFTMLYLAEPSPENITGSTPSKANIAQFSMDAGSGRPCHSNTSYGTGDIRNPLTFNILDWEETKNLPEVFPIDGKNVTFWDENSSQFACLGKGGLYVFRPSEGILGEVVTFSDTESGSRPVNGLFVEDWDAANGHHYTDGFIYVANGACLTILDYYTLEKVAEFSAFDGSGKASANYIHVVKTNDYPNSEYVADRIITVAYGQAGVKVFRFTPPVKPKL